MDDRKKHGWAFWTTMALWSISPLKDVPMPNWKRNKKLLHKDSERILSALFTDAQKRKDPIAAVGFMFEFGRGQLTFGVCANTARKAEKMRDSDRWNSGDYDRPDGAEERFGGWSPEWSEELEELDALAEDDEDKSESIHQKVAEICCEVLADLAKGGVFGDWSKIDFNVAALLDDVGVVEERDKRVRELIASRG